MNRIKKLGLLGVALTTLCSCGSKAEWKSPKTLYVDSYRTFISNVHCKVRYCLDGNLLTVKESNEDYTTIQNYPEPIRNYLGTWTESTYEFVGCSFCATF